MEQKQKNCIYTTTVHTGTPALDGWFMQDIKVFFYNNSLLINLESFKIINNV